MGGPLTVPGTINVTSVSPEIEGTVTALCPYGDRSDPTFTVRVSVVDRDGDEGEATFALTVANVDPTVAIDKSGATLINGVPAFIVPGEPAEPRSAAEPRHQSAGRGRHAVAYLDARVHV